MLDRSGFRSASGAFDLIFREITFKRTTFDQLKAFMRSRERLTGERLTNAAAVDLILRAQFGMFGPGN